MRVSAENDYVIENEEPISELLTEGQEEANHIQGDGQLRRPSAPETE